MSKPVALPAAIKAIREAKAGWDPQARTYHGDPTFSVSVFATRCLLSAAHLCNIEAGRKAATPEVIERIAAQLGVGTDAISYTISEESAA